MRSTRRCGGSSLKDAQPLGQEPAVVPLAVRARSRWRACATFVTPNFGPTAKIVYAACTYVICSILYTGINTPVTAILAALYSGFARACGADELPHVRLETWRAVRQPDRTRPGRAARPRQQSPRLHAGDADVCGRHGGALSRSRFAICARSRAERIRASLGAAQPAGAQGQCALADYLSQQPASSGSRSSRASLRRPTSSSM